MRPRQWPTEHEIIGDMARSNYQPPPDAAALFERHATAIEMLAELKDPVREMAVREMRDNGATVGDLARLTGLSDEYFRKIARAENIELRRPPTVRRLKDD
jgi:hypothetical protein